MWVGEFSFEPILGFFDNHHCKEFIGGNVVEGNGDSELECRAKIQRPAKELSGFRGLRSVEAVEWAMVTAAPILRRIGAELLITEFFPPQGPVDQEPQGGTIRPLLY